MCNIYIIHAHYSGLVEDHMHNDYMAIAMGENDLEDQMESVQSSEEFIAYWELNHKPEQQEADASTISNTTPYLSLLWAMYIIVIVVLLI